MSHLLGSIMQDTLGNETYLYLALSDLRSDLNPVAEISYRYAITRYLGLCLISKKL